MKEDFMLDDTSFDAPESGCNCRCGKCNSGNHSRCPWQCDNGPSTDNEIEQLLETDAEDCA